MMSNDKEISDEQQLAHLLAKDLNGNFPLVLERYSAIILAVLRKYILKEDDIEDAFQEVVIKAYRQLETYPKNQIYSLRLAGWLTTIAHHYAIDHLRQLRRRASREHVSHADEEAMVAAIAVEDSTLIVEKEELLQELLQRASFELRPKYMKCVVLDTYGYSKREIAQMLNLRVESVPVYLSVARTVLRKIRTQLLQ